MTQKKIAFWVTWLVLISFTFGIVAPVSAETISRIEGHCSVGVSSGSTTWYFPEGSCAYGFETWLLVQNPNPSNIATCRVSYLPETGNPVIRDVTVGAEARVSCNMLEDIKGSFPSGANASIVISSDIPVIAERSMYRNDRREGHDSIGTSKPATDFYLAEGSTAWGFTTYVLVQNPNSYDVDVTLTYMADDGPIVEPTLNMAALSRKTIRVNDAHPNINFSTKVHGRSPIIAERSMYWDNGTGEACHDSIGVTQPSGTWYMAEGSTNGGFETWVLIQNPGDKVALANVTYMTSSGEKTGPVVRLDPESRQSINVADTLPSEWDVSTKVVSDQPVICERAVYWNNKGGGHDSIGVTDPATTWYLAEGSTGGTFETWVLVQNPGEKDANVQLIYMTPTGRVSGPKDTISPQSRKSFNVAERLAGADSVSTMVISDTDVIAERSMYWGKVITPPPAPEPAPEPTPTPAPTPAPATGPFVGSVNSNVYHYTWCQYAKAIHPENLIVFQTANDAVAAGYRPCKVCNPPLP